MKHETDNCPFVRFCTETRCRSPIRHLVCSPHPKPVSGQDSSPTMSSGDRQAAGVRERETTRRGKELEGSQWPTDYFWHRIKNETSIAQKLRHIAQARELFSAASAASVTVTVTVTGSATASSCSPSLPSPPPSTRPQPPDKVGLVLRGLMPASR